MDVITKLASLLALAATVAAGSAVRADDSIVRLPPPVQDVASYPVAESASWELPDQQPWLNDFEVGAQFNKGLYIRSTDLNERPYSMYIGGRIQLRFIGFSRNETSWTDNAGVVRAVRNRNQFDIERARLNISGTALSPDLEYLFIFDADGDGSSITDGLAFIFTYEVDPALKVRIGRWKVAADRQWLLSSRYQRLSDRSIASEFFRVGFSEGIWLLGDFSLLGSEGWHYETSLTNGLRTSSRASTSLDDNLGMAATLYCDAWGDYGQGDADFGWHESPVIRFGSSVGYDKSDDRSDAGATFGLGDDNFVRLSDGTRLADVGALAPGVTLTGDRLLLAAFDVGWKYRGWSANFEYFIRSLQDLTADGPLPMTQIYTYGFHAEAGKFIVRRRLDANVRMSQVSGMFGDSFEYACGLNYYFGSRADDRVNKFTLDVSQIKHSAVSSTTADILPGDDGMLFRGQVQIGF